MTAVCYFIPGALSRGPLGQQELLRRQAYLQARTAATTRVEVHESPDGPPSIESPEDEAAAVPTVLEAVPDLDARGFDAVIVGCFGDPGVRQAQDRCAIPVIGPAAAACAAAARVASAGNTPPLSREMTRRESNDAPSHVDESDSASSEARRFGVLTIDERVCPLLTDLIRGYGLEDQLVEVLSVDVPVLELRARRDEVMGRLELAGRGAVDAGAEALVLGCMTMGFLDVAEALSDRLQVVVINPVAAALEAAEAAAAG